VHFENIEFDLHALEESGAAWLLDVKGGGHVETERCIWPCGYQKLAAAYHGVSHILTSSCLCSIPSSRTCFWAGNKLKITMVDGNVKCVQQYLRDAFLDMYEVVAQTVGSLEGVIGFEVATRVSRT
jgi:hypothetical protein